MYIFVLYYMSSYMVPLLGILDYLATVQSREP